MASSTGVSIPIYGSRSAQGQQPEVRRLAEGASKTFLTGTPVQLTSGYLAAWDGTTVALGICGFSMEPGKNRTSNGVAQIITTPPAVPNEANAVTIQIPPFDDGKMNIYVANNQTYFYGEANTTATQANIGVAYGLTKDTNGYWYVDFTNTTTPSVVVTGLDDWDTRGVFFQVLASAIQQI